LKKDSDTTIREMRDLIRAFVHERGWEEYHTPKNLAESICVEAAELLELFQWATSDEAESWKNEPYKLERVGEELADIIIYCLSLANTMRIEVAEAVRNKLERNEIKYPAEKYRGKTPAKN